MCRAVSVNRAQAQLARCDSLSPFNTTLFSAPNHLKSFRRAGCGPTLTDTGRSELCRVGPEHHTTGARDIRKGRVQPLSIPWSCIVGNYCKRWKWTQKRAQSIFDGKLCMSRMHPSYDVILQSCFSLSLISLTIL